MMTPDEYLASLDGLPEGRRASLMTVEMRRAWAQKRIDELNSPAYLAKVQRDSDDAAAKAAIKGDAFVQNFVSMTPDQASAYVTNNTENLAQVRALLEKMALILLALAKREYR